MPSNWCVWTGSYTDRLRANLDLPSAWKIIEAWRADRGAREEDTTRKYRIKAEKLFEKCRESLGYHARNIDVFDALMSSSRRLKPAAWQHSRSSLIDFVAWRIELNTGTPDADEYAIPLALLISATKPPFLDERRPEDRWPKRATSITQPAAEKLFAALHAGVAATSARDFANVTLLTGARPVEWRTALVRRATSADIRNGVPADLIAIEFRTAKKKAGMPVQYRTVLVEAEVHGPLIERHMEAVSIAVRRGGEGPRSSYENWCRNTSTLLREVARGIWPREKRVTTLYTFRDQARANFVALFGKDLAAELLGHRVRTGRKYYPSEASAWARASVMKLCVEPSEAMRASASQSKRASRERFESQPWIAEAPVESERPS